MKLDDERLFDILKLGELGFEYDEDELWKGRIFTKDKAKAEFFYNSDNRKSFITFTLDGVLWVDAVLCIDSVPEPVVFPKLSIPIQYNKKINAVWRLARVGSRPNAETPISKEEIDFVSSILNDHDNFT